MSYSRLIPAKVQPGLCQLRYRISTQSLECQQLFDQGLGYFYSYVWHEAARSFETATRYDPDCAMAWWGLSRALKQWNSRSGKANDALKKAYALREHASYAEQQLIDALATERGLAKGSHPTDASARRVAACKMLDNLILLHPDDEEAWMLRGILASEGSFFGGKPAGSPYYLAVTRLNPLHPGANHELLHQYENSKRPALGWAYSEKYIESSPGIPHSWHMQGHLATRLGRWENASLGALKSIQLQREHNHAWKLNPKEDHQWSHHLETCMQILTHQGRFREARQVYEEMLELKFSVPETFGRFHFASRDTSALEKFISETRSKDKVIASYFAALHHLQQGEVARAQPEIEVLEESLKNRKSNKKLQNKLWETRGLSLCKSGMVQEGLALLKKAADASKDDYEQHAWGHGAYFMEVWGFAALAAGREDDAEEAFLEAIAHDPGSFRGPLGLQVLCERQGRTEDAKQYQKMAEQAWQHAEVRDFNLELAHARQLKPGATLSTSVGP
ncbi:MAG TPA: tetratricopeptide repeat protein [Gemmatales bacterium]|nr:tetratricopeptide repeat protein [Gemmatales bacterium]HMP16684.1 tetratricopeptide repeat protein [Gemmatales bacterium]